MSARRCCFLVLTPICIVAVALVTRTGHDVSQARLEPMRVMSLGGAGAVRYLEGKRMTPSEWRDKRIALERWRDLYLQYRAASPSRAASLRAQLDAEMTSAEEALA